MHLMRLNSRYRWLLSNIPSESSFLEDPCIIPADNSKPSASGTPTDSISRSLYPLPDGLLMDSQPQSMSNKLTSEAEEVTTPDLPVKLPSSGCALADMDSSIDCLKTPMFSPSAPSPASLDGNDTPVVPGSWYGPGLSSLVNDAAHEHHTSHSVNDVLTRIPQQSILKLSPLCKEALLNGPSTPHSAETRNADNQKDRPLVELTRPCSMSNLSLENEAIKDASDSSEVPLSAGYLEDITAPDGQAFSAGVTFIKVWRMINNGSRDWPADTEVVFVGGAQLTNGNPPSHIQPMYPVGSLKPGQEKSVWTPELRVGN